MGIDWHTARFLIGCSQSGVKFDRTLTLGHQNLFVSHLDAAALFEAYGRAGGSAADVFSKDGYADEFFAALGAKELVTLDASEYEGASIIHDMNEPVPQSLHESVDVVLDGGSLEHVFNFPIAMRNCMEMVRVGGHLLVQTPANGFLGHGFYQFSPELFYRVLSAQNGFEVERIIACETYRESQWYEVADPATAKTRVELVRSEHRVHLLIRARRTHKAPVLQATPQQSDYVATWTGAGPAGPSARPGIRKGFISVVSRAWWRGLLATGTALPVVRQWAGKRLHAARARAANRHFSLEAQPALFRPVDR